MNQRRKGEGKDKKNHPRHSQVSVAARRPNGSPVNSGVPVGQPGDLSIFSRIW
jgi:hypothetical protein